MKNVCELPVRGTNFRIDESNVMVGAKAQATAPSTVSRDNVRDMRVRNYLSSISITLALALMLAGLLPSESQAQCTVTSATWVTSPNVIACGQSDTFTFNMKGTCGVIRQLYYTVYDQDSTGDNDLVAETHEVNLPAAFDKSISFDLTCDADCSELNGTAGDSDENPTGVFVLLEGLTGFDLGNTPTVSVDCYSGCGNAVTVNRTAGEGPAPLFRSASEKVVTSLMGTASVIRAEKKVTEALAVADRIFPGDTVVAESPEVEIVARRSDILINADEPLPKPGDNTELIAVFDEILQADFVSLSQDGICFASNNCGLQFGDLQIVPYSQYSTAGNKIEMSATRAAGGIEVTNSAASAGQIAVRKGKAPLQTLAPGESAGPIALSDR